MTTRAKGSVPSRHGELVRALAAAGLLAVASGAQAAMVVDTLEDLAVEGVAVTGRTIGGVTVSISAGAGTVGSRMYGDGVAPEPTVAAFYVGGNMNKPAASATALGTWFISTSEETSFNNAEGITFTFSQGISAFGLTTIDLLEKSGTVTLTAYNADGVELNAQTLTGAFGKGAAVPWLVQSTAQDIARVVLDGSVEAGTGGYGIDNLTLAAPESPTVPVPAAVWLLSSGLMGLAMVGRRRAKA